MLSFQQSFMLHTSTKKRWGHETAESGILCSALLDSPELSHGEDPERTSTFI